MNAPINLANVRAIKTVSADDSLYFPVSMAPIEAVVDGERIYGEDFRAVVREDTGQVLAVHKTGYKLVKNADIYPAFEDALKRSQLDLNGMYYEDDVSYNGGRCMRSYFFPEHRVEIAPNDLVDLQLRVINSYDGSSAFQALVGAYRLLCSNGMVIGQKFSQTFGKHTQGLDINTVVRKVGNAIDVYCSQADVWSRWTKTALSDEQAIRIIDEMPNMNDKLRDHLLLLWQVEKGKLGNTKWALFNALTYWSTHTSVKQSSSANAGALVLQRETQVRRVMPLLEAMREAA